MISDIREVKLLQEIIERKFFDVIRFEDKLKQDRYTITFLGAMRLFPLLVMVASDDDITKIILLAQIMQSARDAMDLAQFITDANVLYRTNNKAILELQNGNKR